jgi:hypothetical protein
MNQTKIRPSTGDTRFELPSARRKFQFALEEGDQTLLFAEGANPDAPLLCPIWLVGEHLKTSILFILLAVTA